MLIPVMSDNWTYDGQPDIVDCSYIKDISNKDLEDRIFVLNNLYSSFNKNSEDVFNEDYFYCVKDFFDRAVLCLVDSGKHEHSQKAKNFLLKTRQGEVTYKVIIKEFNLKEILCWQDDSRPIFLFTSTPLFQKIKYLFNNYIYFSEREITEGIISKIFNTQIILPRKITEEFSPKLVIQKNQEDILIANPDNIFHDKSDKTLNNHYFFLARPEHKTLIEKCMTEGSADFHIHTTASDSSDSPEEVCRRVVKAGLTSFSVTDHDNMSAIKTVQNCLSQTNNSAINSLKDIIFIPGVEISVQEERELHLLAYFPYGGQENLQTFLEAQQNAREARNIKMVETLQALGYDISLEDLNASGDYSVGRMQMALLLKARGYVKTTAQAFADILGYGKPGYIERPRPTLREAILQIRLAGGVPVLAHPALYGWCRPRGNTKMIEDLSLRLSEYRSWGLIGIEAFHGEAEKSEQDLLSNIALKLRLLRTGGSDDHGHNKQNTTLFRNGHFFY